MGLSVQPWDGIVECGYFGDRRLDSFLRLRTSVSSLGARTPPPLVRSPDSGIVSIVWTTGLDRVFDRPTLYPRPSCEVRGSADGIPEPTYATPKSTFFLSMRFRIGHDKVYCEIAYNISTVQCLGLEYALHGRILVSSLVTLYYSFSGGLYQIDPLPDRQTLARHSTF